MFDGSSCDLCQQVLSAAAYGTRCQRCTNEHSSLDSCTARVAFSGNAETWIREFKYPGSEIAGLVPGPEAIATALVRDAALPFSPPDMVVPIPLHVNRLRERGFNPATTLARAVAEQRESHLVTNLLVRIRDTPSQTHLGKRARRKNVRNAFACTRTPAENVWLVDDVVTTGSTLEEAARCLRAAGASRVHAICIARTPQR